MAKISYMLIHLWVTIPSIEKWVIPIEEGENISPDYEWINIAITKYYFKDKNAWQNGKRIIGK